MTTIGVPSGTVLRRQIGSLSARSRIWTIDMDASSFPPMKRSAHVGALHATARALRWLGRRIAERRRNRRGYQELAAMSDIELEDLGISRADFDAIFAGKYHRAGQNSPNLIMPDRRDQPSPGEASPHNRNGGNARSNR